jgi:hypothetical protein
MLLVLNVLLVYVVGLDTLRSKSFEKKEPVKNYGIGEVGIDAPAGEKCNKFTLELRREISDVSPCIFAHDNHLSQVGLGGDVHLEAVFVAALLLTHLAVPPQALQAF